MAATSPRLALLNNDESPTTALYLVKLTKYEQKFHYLNLFFCPHYAILEGSIHAVFNMLSAFHHFSSLYTCNFLHVDGWKSLIKK